MTYLWAFVLFSSAWAAIPVFRNPSSPLSSGAYQRGLLEQKTRDVQVQSWIQVEHNHQTGWVPDRHIWQAVDLSSQVRLAKGTPLRKTPQSLVNPVAMTPASVVVSVRQRQEGWIQVIYDKKPFWIAQEICEAALASSDEDVIVAKTSPLMRTIPARVMDPADMVVTLPAGERVRILSEMDVWTQVRTAGGETGFVSRDQIWRPTSVKQMMVRASGSQLRKRPNFQAESLEALPAGTQLEAIHTQSLRWGLARLGSDHQVWWPIEETPKAESNTAVVTKKTSQLFRDSIFDMASSPLIPNLRFLSASGIYRTLDGENWEKLEDFSEQDYPVAISSNGHVFIGDTKSRDHGLTFEGYIQWDQLVAAIRHTESISLNGMKLMKIEFPEGSDQLVQLTLQAAGREFVVMGQEQGIYRWRLETSRKL